MQKPMLLNFVNLSTILSKALSSTMDRHHHTRYCRTTYLSCTGARGMFIANEKFRFQKTLCAKVRYLRTCSRKIRRKANASQQLIGKENLVASTYTRSFVESKNKVKNFFKNEKKLNEISKVAKINYKKRILEYKELYTI